MTWFIPAGYALFLALLIYRYATAAPVWSTIPRSAPVRSYR